MVKSKKSAAAMMLVFVLMVALVGPHAAAKTEPSVSYSGEDIFSGIFFGQGEVASSFLKYGIPRLSKRLIRMN